ncbi:hypothetical protein TrRE_jg6854, partial [Triparma retinervis]
MFFSAFPPPSGPSVRGPVPDDPPSTFLTTRILLPSQPNSQLPILPASPLSEKAITTSRFLCVDRKTETISLVHPLRSMFTFIQRLDDIKEVSKASVDGDLVVRISFWTLESPLYLKAGLDNGASDIVACLKSSLCPPSRSVLQAFGTEASVPVDSGEIGGPGTTKGVEFTVLGACVVEMGRGSIRVARRGAEQAGEGEGMEWGYDQLGLCSFSSSAQTLRLHFNDGSTLSLSSSSLPSLLLLRSLALGRSSSLRLAASLHGSNTLHDNNGGKGLDLDLAIVRRSSLPSGDGFGDPFLLGEGEVVIEGNMATKVDLGGGEEKAGGGTWKEMHFELKMEREGGEGALLPVLKCYGSSRKRKVLFKVGVANSAMWIGGGEGIITPLKYGYGFGIGLPGSIGSNCGLPNSSMAVLCSSSPVVVARWVHALSCCLSGPIRNFLTARDAG